MPFSPGSLKEQELFAEVLATPHKRLKCNSAQSFNSKTAIKQSFLICAISKVFSIQIQSTTTVVMILAEEILLSKDGLSLILLRINHLLEVSQFQDKDAGDLLLGQNGLHISPNLVMTSLLQKMPHTALVKNHSISLRGIKMVKWRTFIETK